MRNKNLNLFLNLPIIRLVIFLGIVPKKIINFNVNDKKFRDGLKIFSNCWRFLKKIFDQIVRFFNGQFKHYSKNVRRKKFCRSYVILTHSLHERQLNPHRSVKSSLKNITYLVWNSHPSGFGRVGLEELEASPLIWPIQNNSNRFILNGVFKHKRTNTQLQYLFLEFSVTTFHLI